MIQVVVGSVLIIATSISWFCCWLIRKYLKKKPLGMQTLLDRFALTFMKVYLFHISYLPFILYFASFPLPLHPKIAQLCFYLSNFNYNNVLIWLITVTFIKVKYFLCTYFQLRNTRGQ